MTSDNDTSDDGGHRDHAVLIETLRDDHTLLDHRVADLAAALDTLAETFDRLEDTLRAALSQADPDTPATDTTGDNDSKDSKNSSGVGDSTARPDMRVLGPWVRRTIAERCERKLPQGQGRIRWCRSWWRHREAVARFGALYRAWIEATDPETGTGTALVAYFEHLDHALEVLMSEHGPFAGCPGGQHRPPGRGDPTVGHLGQDRHPDETAATDDAEDKEPQR